MGDNSVRTAVRIIHNVIRKLSIEEVFIFGGKYLPVLSKFVPLPHEYDPGVSKIVKRDGVTFNLEVSDYMQWSVYVNEKDISWKLASRFIKENGAILDIGSNCGAFSLKLAHLIKQSTSNTTIYSFDPNPYIEKTFTKNLSLNPSLVDFIEFKRLAIGKEAEQKHFVFEHANSGAGHLTESKLGTDAIIVDVITVDEFVKQVGIDSVGFIKIDIEGYEPEALIGASDTISKFRPGLYIEMTNEWFVQIGSSTNTILNFLNDLNYELYMEMNGVLKPYDAKIADSVFQYNLFAKPL